ncbi:hypothetical protein [Desulfobacter sp. UBA2225]|uniref:hypothetical protein n=1 Tax=Desulfobacter sp. UBA2225 TaxID=1961413 RepID=UPI00257C28DB|nr:hypothetical protein [Desulfobacter sp. UBA2225]
MYVLGLGYLVISILYSKKENLLFIEIFPLIFTSGLTACYLLLLLCQSLSISLLLGSIFSGISVLWLCFDAMRVGNGLQVPTRTIYLVAWIIIILFLYYIKILFDPLQGWDARSIWFFHAKMIWTAETINAGWNHPSVQFSHVGYPKLVPVLTAQIAYVLGYWNEYAPKLSLFFLLIPAIFWIYSFYKRSFSFLFLALVFPFGGSVYMWNGTMDGYIAFYTAIVSTATEIGGKKVKYGQEVRGKVEGAPPRFLADS